MKLQSAAPAAQSLLAVNGGSTELIGVTKTHPFHVAGRGWVKAMDLHSGDRIDARNGTLAVLATALDVGPHEVYNLSISSDVSYFAGDLGAWVHNGAKKDGKKGKKPTPPHEGTSKSHEHQQSQSNDAWQIIDAACSLNGDKGKKRKWHDAITKKNLNFDEIVQIGKDMFSR